MPEYGPSRIAAPPANGRRPFWSVMIPAYNRTAYLEKALRSVLAQDPGPEEMQIEVVDDASLEDDPEPLVRRVAGGRVSFVRNPRHLGLMANFNHCIARSRGYWVHILHTDDYVLPGFYTRLKAGAEVRSDVGAAFCRHAMVDEGGRCLRTSDLESPAAGILPDFIERIGASSRIQFASIAVRRTVYEELGGFRTDLYAADWLMWKRVAARYPLWYEPEILATWRIHSGSQTADLMRSGRNVAEARRCIEISRTLLPPDRAAAITQNAKEWLSRGALDTVEDFLRRKEFAGAWNQFCEGLRCNPSAGMIKAVLFQVARLALDTARKSLRRSRGGLLRAEAP